MKGIPKIRQHFFFLSIFVLMSFFSSGCSQKRDAIKSATHQKATMRAYSIRGKHYSPTYVEIGQIMTGISSWYGPNFHGKHTSNGEVYDMHAKTAAHKTWPMNTMVRVTNLQNGKNTIVRINDRGPFVKGRIIDCSYTAGKELGLDKMGIAKVSIEVVGFAGKVQSMARIKRDKSIHQLTRVTLSNFGIQVGAFKREEGAYITKKTYARLYPQHIHKVKKFRDKDGMPLYRVWMMGFNTEEEARDFKESHNLHGAFIVRN